METDLLKGHLDLLLLGILHHEPSHGYAVIAALRERTEGTFDLSEGTVYPALHRMQDSGLLASDWENMAGRRRRVYRVTAEGRIALAGADQRWRSFARAIDSVLRGRPAVQAAGSPA